LDSKSIKMKEIDFDSLVNRFLEEYRKNKDKHRMNISVTLQEHIEVLKLIEKMRHDETL